MNEGTLSKIPSDLAAELKNEVPLRQSIMQHYLQEHLAEKVERAEVMILTDDEERMLKAYRSCTKDVFKWRTPRKAIVTPKEPSLLIDPCDVS